MKLNILFICFIVFSFPGLAQEKRIVIVSPFSVLKTFSGMEVQLIPSEENKVIVYGDYQQTVNVQQKGSTLKIKQSITSLVTQEFSFAEIYYSQPIDHITANQRSKILSKQPLVQEEISLKEVDDVWKDFLMEFEDGTLTHDQILILGNDLFLRSPNFDLIKLIDLENWIN